VVLSGIKTSQNSFRAEYDHYARIRTTPHINSTGTRAPWDALPCSAECRRDNIKACNEFSCIGYEPSSQAFGSYACYTREAIISDKPEESRPPELTCVAYGRVYESKNIEVYIYGTNNEGSSDKIIVSVPERIRKLCPSWKNATAGDVYNCPHS